MNHVDPHDRSPALAELLDDAFVVPVDVETAARHLWAIHREANRLEATPSEEDPRLVGAGAGAGGGRRTVPRAAVPLLVIVMMMSSSGMALAASQSSLPGDVLYPVKRGTEQAQLIFARSPEARAQLQLSFARARLDEIRQIATTRPQHVPALVAAINVTLTEVDRSEAEAAPDSERIREEITAEIAALQLPAGSADSPVTTAQTAATQAAPVQDATLQATSAQPGTPTATPTPVASAAAVAGTPSDTPTATGTPTDPAPTGSETATAGQPGSEAEADGGGGVAASPSEPSRPSPTPSSSPSSSPSPSPTPTASPEDGPIVSARPHGNADGGSSRSDDGSDAPTEAGSPDPEVTPAPSEEPAEPTAPYVRNPEGS